MLPKIRWSCMRYYNRMIAMHNKAKFAELQMCSKKCLGDSESDACQLLHRTYRDVAAIV